MLFPWWWSALSLPPHHVRGEGDDMIYWLPLGITTAAWIDFDNDRDWLWKNYMIFQLGFWQQRHVQRSKYLYGSPVQKSQRQREKQVSAASKEPTQIITWKEQLYWLQECLSTFKLRFRRIQICSLVKLNCGGWNFPCRFYASGWVCWKPSHSASQQFQEWNWSRNTEPTPGLCLTADVLKPHHEAHFPVDTRGTKA